ncbi:MAG: hypothetical protein AUF79_11525 [Crenarchaeota archaeon 13_1_20CM_2_51_8]|nr:MAG: hypothetical protein AUF79_11525 [Crenarchaeota archaeon 13_1_20CM_2_51_8]
MASETKNRETWTEQEDSARNVVPLNQLRLSRVFRFNDPQTGAPQISDFPDSNPTGDTPLEIRMKHFTEIENFSFLAHVLGHELGGTTPRPIRTVAVLQVPDDEFQSFVNTARTVGLTDEELADSVLDVGINWEHFVASNDNLLIPEHPLKITDVQMQEKIDSLDFITEAFVREINFRSIEKATGPQPGTKTRKSHGATPDSGQAS